MYELAKYVFWSGGLFTKPQKNHRSCTEDTELDRFGISCERVAAAVPESLDGLSLGELTAFATEGVPVERGKRKMDMLKGWRTVLWNGVIVAGGTAFLQWALDYNWVDAVGPVYAMWIVAAANVMLRMVTNTPIGVK